MLSNYHITPTIYYVTCISFAFSRLYLGDTQTNMIRLLAILLSLFAASSAYTEVVECSACVLNRESWLGATDYFVSAVQYNTPDCPINDWTATLNQESAENVWTTLTQQYLVTLANYNSALTNDAYCRETALDFVGDHELYAQYERARAIIEAHCGDIPLTQQETRDEALAIAGNLGQFNSGMLALSTCVSLSVIQPETGNVPIQQQYNTASQGGILVGIVLGFLLVIALLWLVQTRLISRKLD